MKRLSLLLILCLLAASLPVSAFAWEDADLPAEAATEAAEGFADVPGLYVDAPEPVDGEEVPASDADDDAEPVELAEFDLPAVDAFGDELLAQEGEAYPADEPDGDPAADAELAEAIVLGVGERRALEWTMPEEGAPTFASSDEAVATVDGSGTIRAVAVGEATVAVLAGDAVQNEWRVVVKKAPDALRFASKTLTLGVGETASAPGIVLGKEEGDCAGACTLVSLNKKVLSVEPDGTLRALKTGKAVLTAKSYNGLAAKCTVTVCKAPGSVSLRADKAAMGVGETGRAVAALPKKTAGALSYASDDPQILTVDAATGALSAVGPGTARVTVTTYNGKTASTQITVLPAPVTLYFDAPELVLGVGMTLKFSARVNDGAAEGIDYAVGNRTVVSYDKGVLKARAVGETVLTASTYNGLSVECRLVVKPRPSAVRLPFQTLMLYPGDVIQLTPDVGDSASTFTYKSSAPKKVSVSADGVVECLALGTASVTVTTYNRKKCKVTIVVVNKPELPGDFDTELPVDLSRVTLTVPARTTDVDGIAGNLKKIDAIRRSALGQIDAMLDGGIIADADAARRREMVNAVFADYAFPWMTPALQKYWKAANSEGGAKDFKPDRVYYGLPYISGTGANRLYNAHRALTEGRYTDSGEGYYLLNQKRLLNKKYCGSDCSGLVSVAIWGSGRAHSTDRTTNIAKASYYRDVGDFGHLRTGDLICKSNAHVVMFLYYTAADRSRMMVIENGGSEAGVNTVHCTLMSTAYYQLRGYAARRLATLG